ncbi:MAG: hypothetical protein ABH874_04340, partial [Methanobacteriota archaeon]
MGANINVTLPEKVAEYLKRKSKEGYLPISAVARQYIAKGVVEEMVLDYHKKGFSISKISQLTETPVTKVMGILSKLGEELEDIDEE